MKCLFYFFIFFLLLIGCTKPATVDFTIKDNASIPVIVRFHKTGSVDTLSKKIFMGYEYTILQVANETGLSNWYNDFQGEIIGIYDNLGQSISFNPNVSSYWILTEVDKNFHYTLNIDDSSF